MMTFLSDRLPSLDSRFCLLLTWALIHFVWQGCLLAVGFAVVRRVLARSSANARYLAGMVTLLLMAACLPATVWLLDLAAIDARSFVSERFASAGPALVAGDAGFNPLSRIETDNRLHVAGAALATTGALADNGPTLWSRAGGAFHAALQSASVYATVAYALGLVLMLTRVCVGLSIGRRLRRASIPVSDPALLELVRGHAARLALWAVPTIAMCSRVSVPVVVGMLRPMILLPTSLATGLTGRQLEYVLLHELAHIHRYDLLANLLQRLIEVMLFFHPAVWWLTRQVSIERENACDDAVLRAGCQRAAYADALLRVAELCALIPGRVVSPTGLLAATGENRSQLAHRVHRLFSVEQPATVPSATPTVAMLVLFGASAIIALAAWRSPATAQVAQETAAPSNAASIAVGDEQRAASPTENAKTPNPETAVAGVLARRTAWRSGRFDFHWGGAVAGQSVGVRDDSFVFDRDRWKKILSRGATAQHKDCLVMLLTTPQNDGTIRSSLTITPNWLVAEGKAGELAHEEAARPPVFAGTLWREGEARFLAANAAAGKFLETRVVNGVETQAYEWNLTKADVWAVDSFLPGTFDGGKLRLFVSEAMNYVLPRVELLTPAGEVTVAYDGFDFQQFAPGLFIPLRLTRSGMYTESCTLSNISLVNDQHFPEAALKIAIPLGIQVVDYRVAQPPGRQPGDGCNIKPTRITEQAQLAAMPELRDLLEMSAEPLDRQDPAPVAKEPIVEIRVVGNETRATEQNSNSIPTRLDRPLDPATVEQDVQTLAGQKLVEKRETHFQLRKGRIAYVPFTEFTSKVRSLFETKAHKLRAADEITETYGPLFDFTVRYTLARANVPCEEAVRSGQAGSHLRLAAFNFYPVSADIGEPVADALSKTSRFRRKLEECNPDRYAITFWIYPDSIDDFDRVQKELHELGFAVATHLMPENRPIGGAGPGSKSNAKPPPPGPDGGADARPGNAPGDALVDQELVEIRVAGNETRATEQILNSIGTRVGQPLDRARIETDVRTLAAKKWFLDVRPIVEIVDAGVRLTFEVIERPTLLYVKYLGNTKIRDKRLAKETDLRRGATLDPAAVEEGRIKIEQYYHQKGYDDVRVQILEGAMPGDRGAIYKIDEGQSSKPRAKTFAGSTLTSGKKGLKTIIETKPPILGLFKGEQDEKEINADIDKLITYYRGLGFFRARVSRQVRTDEEGERPRATFVIDEGPRCRIAGINFVGNQKLSDEELSQGMVIKENEFFSRRDLDQDLKRLAERYRAEGFRSANIQPELQFDDEASAVTVVFSVKEADYLDSGLSIER